MKESTMKLIEKHLAKARNKHPKFAENNYQIISIATEELGELAQAVNDGNFAKTKSEAADLIAVLIRLIEDENLQNICRSRIKGFAGGKMKDKLTCAVCKHNPMGICELCGKEIPESYVIRRNKLSVWCPLKKGKK